MSGLICPPSCLASRRLAGLARSGRVDSVLVGTVAGPPRHAAGTAAHCGKVVWRSAGLERHGRRTTAGVTGQSRRQMPVKRVTNDDAQSDDVRSKAGAFYTGRDGSSGGGSGVWRIV